VLVALDAVVHIQGLVAAQRSVTEFIPGRATGDIENVLEHGELITTWKYRCSPSSRSGYLRCATRSSYDSRSPPRRRAGLIEDSTITKARLALGGVGRFVAQRARPEAFSTARPRATKRSEPQLELRWRSVTVSGTVFKGELAEVARSSGSCRRIGVAS